MIIEYISPIFGGIMDIFTQGGIITYIILFIGIYGLIIALRKIARSEEHTSALQSRI